VWYLSHYVRHAEKEFSIVSCRGYHIVKSENERLGDAPDPLWLSRTAWNAAEEKKPEANATRQKKGKGKFVQDDQGPPLGF
jgi:hypothetical protein